MLNVVNNDDTVTDNTLQCTVLNTMMIQAYQHIVLDTGAVGCGKYSTVPSAAYFSWQGCVSL